ncbi:MAG TPA: M20/M25/M40 family metallo-hydrolase [Pirellulales bacterium]|nr:M20/M25/M40 family metallo-hydrolase [Pirellulales bacterium]
MRSLRFPLTALALAALALAAGPAEPAHAHEAATLAAVESISTQDLRRHIYALADDTLEGREAGSRGGLAAGGYLGREFQKHHLAGGAGQGGYYQSFGSQYRNILGIIEGSDPKLKHEFILVGAHYDHVGYGNAQNSFGPTGYIHNGADDNASGAAGLLETVEAFATLAPPPRRSILFALWDGEEKGLLGSKHWVAHPTVPLKQVKIVFNLDMIGRLRNQRVEVYGSRTAAGLRRVMSERNGESKLSLDFVWNMREDSDHFPFYSRGLPVLMLHTGLHGDYHRPSDDVEKLDLAGTQRVVRLLFEVVHELADRDELAGFRGAARGEPRPEPALPRLIGRLGVSWDSSATKAGRERPTGDGLRILAVSRGSAAEKAGLRGGDRIVALAGTPLRSAADLRAWVLAASRPLKLRIDRDGVNAPLELVVKLTGPPMKLGVSWREDDAEPNTVVLARVVPDSPAARAGLAANDRVYAVNDTGFQDSGEFARLVSAANGPLELRVERQGVIRSVVVVPTNVPGE